MVVCSRDDAVALRLALVVEHVRPGIPLIVTVHGRIVSSQLRRAVSNIRVTSMAEIVAPSLAASCLDDRLLWVRRTADGLHGVRSDYARPQLVGIEAPVRRRGQQLLARLGSLVQPFEPSGRILTAGLFGFLIIRIGGTLLAAAALGSTATGALLHEQTVYLITPDGRIEPFEADVPAAPTGYRDRR